MNLFNHKQQVIKTPWRSGSGVQTKPASLGLILFDKLNLDNDADYKVDKPEQPVGNKRIPIFFLYFK